MTHFTDVNQSVNPRRNLHKGTKCGQTNHFPGHLISRTKCTSHVIPGVGIYLFYGKRNFGGIPFPGLNLKQFYIHLVMGLDNFIGFFHPGPAQL